MGVEQVVAPAKAFQADRSRIIVSPGAAAPPMVEPKEVKEQTGVLFGVAVGVERGAGAEGFANFLLQAGLNTSNAKMMAEDKQAFFIFKPLINFPSIG